MVEDLAEASAVAKNLGYRNRVVTLDGQVVNAGGSFTGGSTARSAGVFTRKQELEELRGKLKTLEERRAAAEKEAQARGGRGGQPCRAAGRGRKRERQRGLRPPARKP